MPAAIYIQWDEFKHRWGVIDQLDLGRPSSNCLDESFGAINAKHKLVNFGWNFVHLAVRDRNDSSLWAPFAKFPNQLLSPPVSY